MKVTYFLEERRVDSEVLGHDVQAEEVAVNARPSHGKAIQVLVLVSCLPEELQNILSLTNKKRLGKLSSVNCIKDEGAETKLQQ